MGLQFTSLNSGSNGNCYYIGNSDEAILVDAGLSCKETEKRLKRLGLSMEKVKAIFVSHEHTDHIKGIPVIADKHRLPVYMTDATMRGCDFSLSQQLVSTFRAYEPVQIGALSVTAFPKFHDAVDPHSFTISSQGINIGVFTDIGAPCEHLIHHFRQCHAAFLESNYDEEMLDRGSYPIFLKNRIRNGHGHLSNRQALELFLAHRHPTLSHLLLGHLSQNNNDPDLVRNIFMQHAGGTKIVVATRYEETAIYTLEGTSTTTAGIAAPPPATARTTAAATQSGTSAAAYFATAPVQSGRDAAAHSTLIAQPSASSRRTAAQKRKTPPVSTQYTLF